MSRKKRVKKLKQKQKQKRVGSGAGFVIPCLGGDEEFVFLLDGWGDGYLPISEERDAKGIGTRRWGVGNLKTGRGTEMQQMQTETP